MWMLQRSDLPCDVCGFHTPEHPSNAWRSPGTKYKWGHDQLCHICEEGMERWMFWDEEKLVDLMPNQRAVWHAVRHTNRLRRAYNLRKKLKSRSHKAYRPMIKQRVVAKLLVANAKPM
jgi:hypothetical protein